MQNFGGKIEYYGIFESGLLFSAILVDAAFTFAP